VTNVLVAPSTAKFPDCSSSYKGDGRYEVRASVDSQNGFGAMIRTHYWAEVQITANAAGEQEATISSWGHD
jgi:hypothetical protein